MIAMAGPARALDTVGGQVTWQASAFGAVVVGLMSMLLVVRHTRAEEESGRDELVRSLVVPRRAPLVAALAVAVLGSVAMGLLVTLSLVSYPLAAADSLALGVGLALCGALFGGADPARRPAHLLRPGDLRPRGCGDRCRLRAARGRRRHRRRPELAEPDRLVPGDAPVLRAALVACAAAARRGSPRGAGRPRPARAPRPRLGPVVLPSGPRHRRRRAARGRRPRVAPAAGRGARLVRRSGPDRARLRIHRRLRRRPRRRLRHRPAADGRLRRRPGGRVLRRRGGRCWPCSPAVSRSPRCCGPAWRRTTVARSSCWHPP